MAALVLLDLSAAFDTVDHAILLRRLETFGFGGTAVHWFESYLVGRRQHVRTPVTFSSPTVIECGVPQGSVLGTILFLLHIADLQLFIEDRVLCPHHFADDTQTMGSARQRRPRALNYTAVFLSVLMSLPAGCDHTGSSSTLLKPKSSG